MYLCVYERIQNAKFEWHGQVRLVLMHVRLVFMHERLVLMHVRLVLMHVRLGFMHVPPRTYAHEHRHTTCASHAHIHL
jgi:hypothetical protein